MMRRVPITVFLVCLASRRTLVLHRQAAPDRAQRAPAILSNSWLTADRQALIDSVAGQYEAIHDFNAEVDMVPALGTAEKSKITEYKDVRAYILFRKPSDIRLIGLYPGGAQQGLRHGVERHRLQALRALEESLPRGQERDRSSPRPTSWRICGRSIFWTPCWCKPIDTANEKVLLMNLTDEDNAFYILHVVHENGNGQLQLSRSIWFNRYNLTIARQFIFDANGNILTDARYSDWKAYDNVPFPKHIEINRPRDEYAVVIDIVKMDINKGVTHGEIRARAARRNHAAGGRPDARPPPSRPRPPPKEE